MEYRLKKVEGNAEGRFFTTDCCIGCGACVVTASKNFVMGNDGTYRVLKQPDNEKELTAVLEAYQYTFVPLGPGPCIVDREDKENWPPDLAPQ